MTTLRHPSLVGLRVVSRARDRCYVRVAYVKPRRRIDFSGGIFRALLRVRDLLLALWAIAVLSLFLVLLAGLLLR